MDAVRTIKRELEPMGLADSAWNDDTVGCELPDFCEATLTYRGQRPVAATHLLVHKTGRVALVNYEHSRVAFWLNSHQLTKVSAVDFIENRDGNHRLAFWHSGRVIFRTWMPTLELRDLNSPVEQPSKFNYWYLMIGLLAVVSLGLVAHKKNLLPFGSCAAR